MQTGFITALQPFGIIPPQVAARRADEPGQTPAERLRDGQAERDRARDRAAAPSAGGVSRAGLIDGGLALVAQESHASEGERDPNGLTEEERRVVSELKQRDAEVRAHEAAHKAAGGAHAGGVSFTYQQGPDGRRYAVGGEVPIDISTVSGDPRATAQKMQQIRRAALAPADPSGPDRAIAAAATKALLEAQAQIASERAAAITDEAGPNRSGDTTDDGALAATTGEPTAIRGRPDGADAAISDQPDHDPSRIGQVVSDASTGSGVVPDDDDAARGAPAASQLTDLPYPSRTASQDKQDAPTLSVLA